MYHESNQIDPTAIIYDNVLIGKNNKIGPYAVIGSPGEIRNCESFEGIVVIGDNNNISELVTIQRPAIKGQKTIIGNNNMIMAHAHIGHDVEIGDNTEICTNVVIGGYCKIKTGAKIKLGSTIRNRKTIGENAIVGLGSAVVKDVEPNTIVYGNPAKQKNV